VFLENFYDYDDDIVEIFGLSAKDRKELGIILRVSIVVLLSLGLRLWVSSIS